MPAPDPWISVATFAARHHGLFQRAAARRFGLTDRQLVYAVARHRIERLSRQVFRFRAAPATWHQQVLAACWLAGAGAHASHATAAVLHGFDGFTARGPIEVVVDRRRRDVVVPGVIVHSTHYLPPLDRFHVGVIPATAPSRTLSDLGAAVRSERVEEALDGAERDGRVRRHQVVERHSDFRSRGRNGVGTLAAILERREALAHVPESVLERRMLRLLERHGLPRPVCQYEVRRSDGKPARLDFAFDWCLVAAEVNGNTSHATPARRAADHERSNGVGLDGWLLLHFTYEDVLRRPDYVAATVAEALAGRRDLAGPGTW